MVEKVTPFYIRDIFWLLNGINFKQLELHSQFNRLSLDVLFFRPICVTFRVIPLSAEKKKQKRKLLAGCKAVPKKSYLLLNAVISKSVQYRRLKKNRKTVNSIIFQMGCIFMFHLMISLVLVTFLQKLLEIVCAGTWP